MSGPSFGDTQGKSRQASSAAPEVRQAYKQFQGQVGGDFVSQLGQMLRTGGIGAQTPIVAQSIGSAQDALSQALTAQQGQLATAGLGRTPYGINSMASTRLQGLQSIAQIPTNYAQQSISQIPGLYSAILGGLSPSSSARSGPYST